MTDVQPYPAPMQPIAVFDLDGTLVDSAPDLHAALDRLMAARGLPPFLRHDIVGMIGDGVPALVTKALAARGRPFDTAALAFFLEDYAAQAAVQTAPFAGIRELLPQIAAAGWQMAVCTNKPLAPSLTLLRDLGIGGWFRAVGAGDSYPFRKPDPAHLLATLRDAGGHSEAAVMIGDHHNDMAAAAGAGVPAIFAGWGYGQADMANGAAVAALPGDVPALLAQLRRS